MCSHFPKQRGTKEHPYKLLGVFVCVSESGTELLLGIPAGIQSTAIQTPVTRLSDEPTLLQCSIKPYLESLEVTPRPGWAAGSSLISKALLCATGHSRAAARLFSGPRALEPLGAPYGCSSLAVFS